MCKLSIKYSLYKLKYRLQSYQQHYNVTLFLLQCPNIRVPLSCLSFVLLNRPSAVRTSGKATLIDRSHVLVQYYQDGKWKVETVNGLPTTSGGHRNSQRLSVVPYEYQCTHALTGAGIARVFRSGEEVGNGRGRAAHHAMAGKSRTGLATRGNMPCR